MAAKVAILNPIPLPATVQQGLDRFCDQLREALGPQLVSVILYGGLAKGEYDPDRSDVNVLVALQTVDTAALDRAAPATTPSAARYACGCLLGSVRLNNITTGPF